MKNFVLFTAILEILAGVTFFCVPQIVPTIAGGGAVAYTIARMYGAAALAVGYFALRVWRNFESHDLKIAFLHTFILFHIGVAASIFIGYNGGGFRELAAGILHTVLALITIYYFTKK